jgi:hypothetical protein
MQIDNPTVDRDVPVAEIPTVDTTAAGMALPPRSKQADRKG